MTKSELGEEYLRKAQIIKTKMDKLEGELHLGGIRKDDQFEGRRRLNLLFDMYLDCSMVGKRLILMDRRRFGR